VRRSEAAVNREGPPAPGFARADGHNARVRRRPWILARPEPRDVAALARGVGSDVLATLLAVRGFTDLERARVLLAPSAMQLHDPLLLPGVAEGSARLARAVRDGEPILVHGDYDVDGVTGTALLMRLLELVGARAAWHIPNRLVDGYSFGPHSLARARATGARVVISVDNGTSAFETIAELREAGVETVVTDHHEPPPPHPTWGALPPAAAIVNPKLPGSSYPWRELCGAGVAFKLAWGLAQELSGGGRAREDLRRFLMDATAYVAIATVCDVVPMLDENRVFAHFGRRALAATANPGLAALLEVAGLAGRELTAEDLAFGIGPRINAAGRLGSADRAVSLLLAREPDAARNLARELDALNARRKEVEAEVLVQARRAAAAYADPERHPVLVLAGQGWHQGVVGIVAARLVDEWHRPAVVIGLDGETGRGSARSVAGFSILEPLLAAREHLLRAGGHAQAAGLEIRADRVAAARQAICERARALLEENGRADTGLAIDLELPFGRMTRELMRELERLAPHGPANPAPVFVSQGLRLAEPPRAVGDGSHLLLQLRSGAHALKAMAFKMGARQDELRMGAPLAVAYTPKWNTFRGATNLELEVLDFQVGAEPVLV
jgi:single-stranded-DNA-specific exonuclease